MAETKKSKSQPSPIAAYQNLKNQLTHAVLANEPADKFANALMSLDTPPEGLLPEGTAPAEATAMRVMLAWVPASTPVTVHFSLDQKSIPNASGTFEGGLLRFPVPAGMYKPGSRLFTMLRFLVGGWRYRLWVEVNGVTHELANAKDPDPSNPQDDFIPTGYTLP